jgi:hypothetical protein
MKLIERKKQKRSMYKENTFGTLRACQLTERRRLEVRRKSRHTKIKDRRRADTRRSRIKDTNHAIRSQKPLETIMTSMADVLRRRIVVAIATERATFSSDTIIDRILALLLQPTKEPDGKSKAYEVGSRGEHR